CRVEHQQMSAEHERVGREGDGDPGKCRCGLQRLAGVRLRLVVGRRGSGFGASKRGAMEAKAAVGAFQWSWSTLSKSGMSVRRVASLRKRSALFQFSRKVNDSVPAFATFTCHSRLSLGIDSRWMNLARTAAEDFAPQPGSPG